MERGLRFNRPHNKTSFFKTLHNGKRFRLFHSMSSHVSLRPAGCSTDLAATSRKWKSIGIFVLL